MAEGKTCLLLSLECGVGFFSTVGNTELIWGHCLRTTNKIGSSGGPPDETDFFA